MWEVRSAVLDALEVGMIRRTTEAWSDGATSPRREEGTGWNLKEREDWRGPKRVGFGAGRVGWLLIEVRD